MYLIKYSFINFNYHFFHNCTFFLSNCLSLSFSFHCGAFLWCFLSADHFKDFILKLWPDDLLLILVCCYWARSSSRKKQGLPFVLFVCSFHCCITEVCQSNGETNQIYISKCLVNIVRNICHNLLARSCDTGTSKYLNCLKTKKDSSLSSILITICLQEAVILVLPNI